jgi:uroporphyrinogen III methyltransferase/synthase
VARTLTFHGRPGHTHALCLTAGPKAERPWTGTLDALARDFAARPRTKARLVVGPGARHAASFRKRLPLADKRVLVTRARAQADALAGLLRDEGAEPVFFPVLDFDASDDPARLRKACDDLASGTYRAVLFTSQNGVTSFVAALRESGRDVRAFGKALVGAVGPATAASLERVGIKADFVAGEHLGEGLAEDALAVLGPASGPSGTPGGKRVLLPRAKVARDVLPNALASAGFEVDVVTAYVTRSAEANEGSRNALVAKLLGGEIDVVTLTSSSTAMRLVEMLGPEAKACLARALVASIGPVATKTAESLGVAVGVTAVTHTAEGLVGALRGHLCAHLDGVRR